MTASSVLRPQLKALFPNRPGSAYGLAKSIVVPQLDAIFDVISGKVAFRSDPNVNDARLDFVGAPPNPDGDPAEFGVVGFFNEWLRGMTRWSSNPAAAKCIDALGYFYINGLLRSTDFFVPDSADSRTGEGLWLSGDYQGHDWVNSAADKAKNAAGPKLAARWADAQLDGGAKRIRGNFVGTAFQTARLMGLIATDRLVGSDSVHANPNAEMRALLAGSIRTINAKSGIGSYIKDALDITPKKPFDALQAKKGFGNDSSSHECGIVERTVGGKKLKYVAVVLGSLQSEGRQDLDNMVRRLDDVVVTVNPP